MPQEVPKQMAPQEDPEQLARAEDESPVRQEMSPEVGKYNPKDGTLEFPDGRIIRRLDTSEWKGLSWAQMQQKGLKYLEEVAQTLHSYDEIFHFVTAFIQNKVDKIEFWQNPILTVIRGIGDCEDWAFLIQTILGFKGQKTFVLKTPNTPDGKGAHALCLWQDNGYWYRMGTYGAVRTDAPYPTFKAMVEQGKFLKSFGIEKAPSRVDVLELASNERQVTSVPIEMIA